MARLIDDKDKLTFTATATSAITTQFRFVKFDTDEDAIVLAGAGDKVCGVLESKAAAGESVAVTYAGAVRVVLGNTVADKAYVMSDANGAAITATATNNIAGYMPAGGAVGEVRTVFLGDMAVENIKA